MKRKKQLKKLPVAEMVMMKPNPALQVQEALELARAGAIVQYRNTINVYLLKKNTHFHGLCPTYWVQRTVLSSDICRYVSHLKCRVFLGLLEHVPNLKS